MAYGQIGTGKTYTVGRLGKEDPSEWEIMVRALEDILANTSPGIDIVGVSYLRVLFSVKKDLVVESHDNAYSVKKGEMLFGYQPFATRDKRVFGDDMDQFVPDRFVGLKGKLLLKYVMWSNGLETENPTVENKLLEYGIELKNRFAMLSQQHERY